MNYGPRKLSSLLNAGNLSEIVSGAKENEKTLDKIKQKIPIEYHNFIIGAWYKNKELCISLNSSEWAAKLRYEVPKHFPDEIIKINVLFKKS